MTRWLWVGGVSRELQGDWKMCRSLRRCSGNFWPHAGLLGSQGLSEFCNTDSRQQRPPQSLPQFFRMACLPCSTEVILSWEHSFPGTGFAGMVARRAPWEASSGHSGGLSVAICKTPTMCQPSHLNTHKEPVRNH